MFLLYNVFLEMKVRLLEMVLLKQNCKYRIHKICFTRSKILKIKIFCFCGYPVVCFDSLYLSVYLLMFNISYNTASCIDVWLTGMIDRYDWQVWLTGNGVLELDNTTGTDQYTVRVSRCKWQCQDVNHSVKMLLTV